MAPHPKPETPQQIHTSAALPYGDAADHSRIYRHTRLGGELGPEGRVPPRAHQAEDRKFLRFMYNSVMYEFATLPFGLSTSPRVFTRVVKTIGAALQRRGVMIFMYLDDWLVVGPSRAATDAALRLTWRLTSDLGFLVNVEKSHPIPSQTPTFLGAALDLRPPRGLARPTEDRVLNLFQCVSFFSQRLWHRQGLGSGSLALWPAWWTWWIFVDSGCGQFSSICCLFTALDTTLSTCRYPLRPG